MKSFSFITALVFAYVFATVQVLAIPAEPQAEVAKASAVPEEVFPPEASIEEADEERADEEQANDEEADEEEAVVITPFPFQQSVGSVYLPATMDMNEIYRSLMAMCAPMHQQARVKAPHSLVARQVGGRGRYGRGRYGRGRYGRGRYGRGRYGRGRYGRGRYGRGRYGRGRGRRRGRGRGRGRF